LSMTRFLTLSILFWHLLVVISLQRVTSLTPRHVTLT